MNWITFNDDDSAKGCEGKQVIEDNTLYIDVNPTSWQKPYIKWLEKLGVKLSVDWSINLCFWPTLYDWTNWRKGLCHCGYKKYGMWLAGYIRGLLAEHPEITKLRLSGYSMGAGIIQITARELDSLINIDCRCIDNIVTCLPQSESMTMYYKKGGLYCLLRWLFKANKEVCKNDEWQPMWRAHYFSDTEIKQIVGE